MDVIKVDDVRLQAAARFIEKTFKVFRAFHDPPGRLGSKIDPVPIASGQRLAGDGLALPVKIDVAGIHIVQALIDGMAHHADDLRFVHGLAVGEHGQAQHAEAQCRDADAGQSVRAVAHAGLMIADIRRLLGRRPNSRERG